MDNPCHIFGRVVIFVDIDLRQNDNNEGIQGRSRAVVAVFRIIFLKTAGEQKSFFAVSIDRKKCPLQPRLEIHFYIVLKD